MSEVEERRQLYDLMRYWWISTLERRTDVSPPPLDDTRQRQRLRELQTDAQQRLRDLVRAYAAGSLSTDIWRQRMEQELRVIHMIAAALGAGGFNGLNARMLSAVNARVEAQIAYLNRWTQAMRPPTPFNEQQAEARAALYAGATTETYYAVRVNALGLPELPVYPGSGDTQCMVNCKCELDIRKRDGNGNWDVYWMVNPTAEHCPDCVELGLLWSPLEIRGGLLDVSRIPRRR